MGSINFEDKIIFDADSEEPKCCRCDYCSKDEKACELCGPEYGWYGYRRTTSWGEVINELKQALEIKN